MYHANRNRAGVAILILYIINFHKETDFHGPQETNKSLYNDKGVKLSDNRTLALNYMNKY